MHTCFLAAAFLSAVTASPLPDFSPFEYVLPSSGQPNNVPIPFQDFFAQTSTNPDSFDLGQPQILAQSPSTDPYSSNFVQPQILAEGRDEPMPEEVRGDSPNGNEPLPLPSTIYLPSDLRFQNAPCNAISSVCCQRAYNGENSRSTTCAASRCFESPFSFLLPSPKSAYQHVLQSTVLTSLDRIIRQWSTPVTPNLDGIAWRLNTSSAATKCGNGSG